MHATARASCPSSLLHATTRPRRRQRLATRRLLLIASTGPGSLLAALSLAPAVHAGGSALARSLARALTAAPYDRAASELGSAAVTTTCPRQKGDTMTIQNTREMDSPRRRARDGSSSREGEQNGASAGRVLTQGLALFSLGLGALELTAPDTVARMIGVR